MSDGQVRVLYVGGIGRSGSTLIERLIGQLPGACPVGELLYLYERGIAKDERCGCGQPFHQCPFWQQVGKAAFGGWDQVDPDRIAVLRSQVDRNRFIPSLARRRVSHRLSSALDEYTTYYARLYAAIAQVSGCDVVVDSSKHPSLAHCLRWQADLDLRVLHLIRDSRAVAYSWSRQVRRPDTDSETYMWRYSPTMAAGQWMVQNTAFHLLSRLGCPTLRLRYEDFIAEPEVAMRRVTEFAGLAAQDGYPFLGADGTSRWAELDGAHSVSGNPMRFATGHVPIRQDERWRTDMPKAQQHAVTALTSPMLAGYGYLGAKP
ncbi:MAG: sulfotransferase [Actinomycetota bacterium]|nr:sulfotransferase [Actinomycetota bacterium]